MPYPSFDEVVASLKDLSLNGTQRNKTPDLWPVLAYLRHRRLTGSTTSLESFDLSVALFDLTGVRLPLRLDAEQKKSFFDPAAKAEKWVGHFRNGEAPRNTYLNKIQSLIGRGDRQLAVFKKGETSLPVVAELEHDWIQVFRSNAVIKNIFDEKIKSLLTWIFRYGVPEKRDGSSGAIAKVVDGVLVRATETTLKEVPASATELENLVADFFGLTVPQIAALMPALRAADLHVGSAMTGIDPSAFGTRLEAELLQSSDGSGAPPSSDFSSEAAEYVIDWNALAADAAASCALVGVEDALKSAIASLMAGKFIIFFGAPGTGKTQLAEHIASTALKHGVVATSTAAATAEWSTFETMGGYSPDPADPASLSFGRGIITESIYTGAWLVIDEINRADFDKAFGELFTLFAGGQVRLPFRNNEGKPIVLVPPGFMEELDTDASSPIVQQSGWRMIGTMNSTDKSSLFQFSYAFMRRFAFVEVRVPAEGVFADLIETRAAANGLPVANEFSSNVTAGLVKVFCGDSGLRSIGNLVIGPAIPFDILDFVAKRMVLADSLNEQPRPRAIELVLDGLALYLLPQFEGRESQHDTIHAMLVLELELDVQQAIELDRAMRQWTNARI